MGLGAKLHNPTQADRISDLLLVRVSQCSLWACDGEGAAESQASKGSQWAGANCFCHLWRLLIDAKSKRVGWGTESTQSYTI